MQCTLMANANDNPLFHIITRQEQIIMAKVSLLCSDLKNNYCYLYSIKITDSSVRSCGFKGKKG